MPKAVKNYADLIFSVVFLIHRVSENVYMVHHPLLQFLLLHT